MNRSRRLFPLVLLLSLATAGGALAQRNGGQERSGPPQPRVFGHQQEAPRPAAMSDSVRRVQRETDGQVLSVEAVSFEGREVHRVKVLQPDGRIRIVVDDPNRPGGERGPTRRNDGTPPTL